MHTHLANAQRLIFVCFEHRHIFLLGHRTKISRSQCVIRSSTKICRSRPIYSAQRRERRRFYEVCRRADQPTTIPESSLGVVKLLVRTYDYAPNTMHHMPHSDPTAPEHRHLFWDLKLMKGKGSFWRSAVCGIKRYHFCKTHEKRRRASGFLFFVLPKHVCLTCFDPSRLVSMIPSQRRDLLFFFFHCTGTAW